MDYTKYQNTFAYPNKIHFTTTFWYRAGKVVAKRVGEETEIFDPRVGELSAFVKETSLDQQALSEAKKAYYAEDRRLQQLFKKDLLEELGITDHPKAELLFKLANDLGDADGLTFEDIADRASDLAKLIK